MLVSPMPAVFAEVIREMLDVTHHWQHLLARASPFCMRSSCCESPCACRASWMAAVLASRSCKSADMSFR